jgi:hypothetical protein
MSLEKPRKLMEALLRRTRAGEMEWQETLPDVFQVSFKANSVQVRLNDQRRQGALVTVALLNGEGEVVDTFTDEDLDNELFGEPGKRNFILMKELYALALRRARGADKVLDEILKDMGEEDDMPF